MKLCEKCELAHFNGGNCRGNHPHRRGEMCFARKPLIETYEDMRRESPALQALELVMGMLDKPYFDENYDKILKPLLSQIVGMHANSPIEKINTQWAWDVALQKMLSLMEPEEGEYKGLRGQ